MVFLRFTDKNFFGCEREIVQLDYRKQRLKVVFFIYWNFTQQLERS